MMKIAILSSSYNCYATQSILKAGKKRGHEMVVYDPAKLYLLVSNAETGYDRLYDGYNKVVDRINAKEIQAIIPRIGTNLLFATAIVEHINRNLGIFSTQGADGIRIAADKIKTIQRCSSANIRTPKTILANDPAHIDFYIEKLGGLPIVVKLLKGSKGVGVSILETKTAASTTLQTYFKAEHKILMQEYIDANSEDYRAVVIGNIVVAAYKRKAGRGDFRANMSLNAQGTPVQLSAEDKDFCIRAARAVNLDVAGVDFLKDKTGNNYLVEVNSNFGFLVQKVCDVDIGSAMIRYVERSYQKNENAKIIDEYYNSELFLALEKQKADLKKVEQKLEIKNTELEFFTKNPELLELYNKTKGQELKYKDKAGRKLKVEINNINDLYQIIYKTFSIK